MVSISRSMAKPLVIPCYYMERSCSGALDIVSLHSVMSRCHNRVCSDHYGHVHCLIYVMSRNIVSMFRSLGHDVIDNIGTMSSSHEHVNISIIRLCPGIVPWYAELYGAMVSEHGYIRLVLSMSKVLDS